MWKVKSKETRDLFRDQAKDWVEGARAAAKQLLRTNQTVTIEDVLHVYPRPEYVNRNITGVVFRHPDFIAVGYMNSRRRISRGNIIRTWRLRELAE